MKLLAVTTSILLFSISVLAAPSYSESIRLLIRKNLDQVEACYNEYIKEKQEEGKLTDAKGHLTVEWNIDAQGKASNFKERRTSFEDKHVFSCVAAKMATWEFPPSANKKMGTTASFPFVFTIKK